MSANKLSISAILLLFIILGTSLVSSISFYQGSVKIETISTDIKISENQLLINSNYVIINDGNEAETISISFPGFEYATITQNGNAFEGSLTLSSKETTIINLISSFPLSESKAYINPDIYFNSMPISKKTERITIVISFNDVSNKILSSSLDLSDGEIKDDLITYTYDASQVYPRLLDFTWSNSAISLLLTRSITEAKNTGDIMTVISTIQNTGEETVSLIELRDRFLSSNYKIADESDESFSFISQPNEAYYKWSIIIPFLNPGEEKSFIYDVEVTSISNLRLLPLSAYVNDTLITSLDGAYLSLPGKEINEIMINDSSQYIESPLPRFIENNNFEEDINLKSSSKKYLYIGIIILIIIVTILIIKRKDIYYTLINN